MAHTTTDKKIDDVLQCMRDLGEPHATIIKSVAINFVEMLGLNNRRITDEVLQGFSENFISEVRNAQERYETNLHSYDPTLWKSTR